MSYLEDENLCTAEFHGMHFKYCNFFKVGICTYLQQSHWFCEEGVSYTKFPRCYNISNGDDLDIFVKDFRITACLGLLKKLVQDVQEDKDIFSESGKVF